MKPDNTLRFMSMVFSAYSFITTIIIAYINVLKGVALSPLEIAALLSAGLAIFIGLMADIISMGAKE